MDPATGSSPPISATDRSTRMIIESGRSNTTTPTHTPPDPTQPQLPLNVNEYEDKDKPKDGEVQTQQHPPTSVPALTGSTEVNRALDAATQSSNPPTPTHEKPAGEVTSTEPPGPGFVRRRSSNFYDSAAMERFCEQHHLHHLHHKHHEHHHLFFHQDHNEHQIEHQQEAGDDNDNNKEERDQESKVAEKGRAEAGLPLLSGDDVAAKETPPTFGERSKFGRKWSWSYEDAKQMRQGEWMKRDEEHQVQ